MMSTLEKLLGVISKLFGLRETLAKAKAERRARLLDLLGKVSECLDRVATDIEKDQIPHGACAELATYAGYLPSLVDEELGPEVAALLGHELEEAHNVEGFFYAKRENPEATVSKLWEASGRLHALVNCLRAAG